MRMYDNKKLISFLGTLKGNVIQYLNEIDFDKYFKWINKLIVDTNKDKKEKKLIQEIKSETDIELKNNLILKKQKLIHKRYPNDIKIGDVVYVDFGYGYCSELSDGHYAIVLTEVVANMCFIIPCSSTPLKRLKHSIKLGVPNKEKNPNKISYLRYDQMRNVHYRRIESISGSKRYAISESDLEKIKNNIVNYLKLL